PVLPCSATRSPATRRTSPGSRTTTNSAPRAAAAASAVRTGWGSPERSCRARRCDQATALLVGARSSAPNRGQPSGTSRAGPGSTTSAVPGSRGVAGRGPSGPDLPANAPPMQSPARPTTTAGTAIRRGTPRRGSPAARHTQHNPAAASTSGPPAQPGLLGPPLTGWALIEVTTAAAPSPAPATTSPGSMRRDGATASAASAATTSTPPVQLAGDPSGLNASSHG